MKYIINDLKEIENAIDLIVAVFIRFVKDYGEYNNFQKAFEESITFNNKTYTFKNYVRKIFFSYNQHNFSEKEEVYLWTCKYLLLIHFSSYPKSSLYNKESELVNRILKAITHV